MVRNVEIEVTFIYVSAKANISAFIASSMLIYERYKTDAAELSGLGNLENLDANILAFSGIWITILVCGDKEELIF